MRAPHGSVTLTEAVEAARTGDIWIFRGHSGADRAIRLVTNAPVNHVGMAVVLDDLPPMMWHAELGRALPDLWTGAHHRGVQLHDLAAAVERWSATYHQQAWLRQLDPEVSRTQEDALLRTIATWNGTSFPSTARLGWRWLRGRTRALTWPDAIPRPWRRSASTAGEHPDAVRPQAAYCAEVVAVTYEAMALLEPGRPANWYDPGRFWSGDALPLTHGWHLGAEISVRVPAAPQG